MRRLACILIILVAATSPRAQDINVQLFVHEYIESCRHQLGFLLEKFTKNSDIKISTAAKEAFIVIPEDHFEMSSTAVEKDGERYKITVSAYLLWVTELLDQAVVYESIRRAGISDPLPMDKIFAYSDYLNAQILSFKSLAAQEAMVRYTSYFDFIGLDEADQAKARSTVYNSEFWTIVRASSQAFLLGHELGHIVNGDTEKDHLGRAEEARADAFSARLLPPIDLDASMAIGTFLMLDRFETTSPGGGPDHPSPSCRYLVLMGLSLELVKKEAPQYVEKMLKNNKITDLDKAMKPFKSNCE